MFGNQIGSLRGKNDSQRRLRPLSSILRRPNPTRQRQYPEFLMKLAKQEKRSLPRDEENQAGDRFLPRRTLRRTATPTPTYSQEDDTEVVVITDNDDTDLEDGSNEGSVTSDIIVTQPLTSKDFADNMKRLTPESPDEGYGSFSSGLGLEDDTRKDSREYRPELEEENDRNGKITPPPRLNKVFKALVTSQDRVGLTIYKQTIGKYSNVNDEEVRIEAKERSRRLREAARANGVPTESTSQSTRTDINGSQRPLSSKITQFSSGQRVKPKLTHERDDIISEARIQEGLARAELEKKRTRFISGSLLPEPRKNWQKAQHASVRGHGGGSLLVPVRATREDKEKEKDAKKVKLAGDALKSYLEKDPENERTRKEYEEYQRCEEKLTRGESLVTAERNRMGELKRNAERREYNLQVKGPQKSTSTVSKAQKQRATTKTSRARPVPEKKTETKEDEEDRKIEELKKVLEAFNAESNEVGSFKGLDCPPTSEAPNISLEDYGKQNDDSSMSGNKEKFDQGARKTVAGKGLVKDIVQHQHVEETLETPVSEEESCSEESEIEEDEPVWQFDVYRKETIPGDYDSEPELLGTYIDRRRAEAVVRAEISTFQASLQELCEIEFSCKFDQNNIREQTISFSSGRSIEVFIEKNVAEVAQGGGCLKRPKKAQLPVKHYLVVEETTELEKVDELFETEKPLATKSAVYKESYIFRRDANKQASILFVAHQTAHLGGEERFDIEHTGSIDTDSRKYLHELEEGERLFDMTEVLPGKEGRKMKVRIWVQEQFMRGPRN